MPRVTILIPTFNRGDLIESTLLNCFNQTYTDFKVLIYDDASTDNTKSIVDKLISKYPNKIKYYKGDRNRGIGYARNFLLKTLDTEFGVWLDSDDLMTDDRIKKCISYMDENKDIEIVYSNIQWFTECDKEIILKNKIDINPNTYNKENWSSLKFNTSCATGFFRNSLKKYEFSEELKLGGEDVLWIWKLLQMNVKIGHINEYLYLYRNHNNRIGKLKRKSVVKDIKAKEDIILAQKIIDIKNAKR